MVNFKLSIQWLLSILGFYIFWCLSYFILAKYALNEVNNLRYVEGGLWKAFNSSRLFWYAIYLGAIALVVYITRLLVNYSPKPAVTALLDASLVLLSGGLLIYHLSASASILQLLPHVLINACFILAIVPNIISYWTQKKREDHHFV